MIPHRSRSIFLLTMRAIAGSIVDMLNANNALRPHPDPRSRCDCCRRVAKVYPAGPVVPDGDGGYDLIHTVDLCEDCGGTPPE